MSTQDICDKVQQTAGRIQGLPGWVIQVYIHASLWRDRFDFFAALPVPVIADHFGGLKGASHTTQNPDIAPSSYPGALLQPGFDELIRLALASKVYIKLSGLYRASLSEGNGYGDLEPIVRALVLLCPDQLIYGSDWPHTGEGVDRVGRSVEQVEPFRVIDTGLVLQNLRTWVGSGEVWRKILVSNPRRLYGLSGS